MDHSACAGRYRFSLDDRQLRAVLVLLLLVVLECNVLGLCRTDGARGFRCISSDQVARPTQGQPDVEILVLVDGYSLPTTSSLKLFENIQSRDFKPLSYSSVNLLYL